MSDNEITPTQSTDPSSATTAHGFEPEPAPRRRWRDRIRGLTGPRERVYGVRGVIAVGLAGLVLGGAGGFALHGVADHHDRPDFGGPGRFGEPFGGDGNQQGDPRGHGLPGELPPSTIPDDGTLPDQSSDSGSSTNS